MPALDIGRPFMAVDRMPARHAGGRTMPDRAHRPKHVAGFSRGLRLPDQTTIVLVAGSMRRWNASSSIDRPRHLHLENSVMKKCNILVGTAIAVLLSSATFVSLAGEFASYPVFINDGIRFAAGNMVTARYSSDDVQRIECKTFAHALGMVSVTCLARNAQGLTRTCFTSVPVLVESAKAASSESQITFRWNEDGDCESIAIDNASRWKR